MTEAEFKERAVPIFAAEPSEESTQALRGLMRKASETISIARIAILSAEALDEAYPSVTAMLGMMGQPTAAERMTVEVAEGRIKDRLDRLN